MKKYIKPEIYILSTEDIMENDELVVSRNTTIDDSEEFLAKPFYDFEWNDSLLIYN